MVYLLYDCILCLAALFLVPLYLYKGLRYGKARRGIRERLGYFAPEFLRTIQGRDVIWVHAVSVGETRAAIPLFKALRQKYPDSVLVLSNVTETGREIAKKVKEADCCIFFPFDLSWVARRVLGLIKPSVVVLVETEIWPNFVREASRQEIPIVLVNGRISDRSFPRYKAVTGLLKPILDCIKAFCMQTSQDGRRIRLLGAESGRVKVTGNLKFDMELSALDQGSRAGLIEEFHLPPDRLVWVAGSTHAGEEEQVLRVYQRLGNKFNDLCLVLVPRHPERAGMVADLLQQENLEYVMRTGLAEYDGAILPGQVLLVDTIGEMMKLYELADLVFVGGSLVPTGGHNILEASLLKKPVVFGPHMHNFKEITRLVKDADGGVQVHNEEDLYRVMCRLLDDPGERRRVGDNGYGLLVQNQGATLKALAEIDRHKFP